MEIKQTISGFSIHGLYNLPVPYGDTNLFLSEYAEIDSTGDIMLKENTLAGTKINTTITYRYK